MHRTDASGNVGGLFSAGDPANGVLPTQLDEDWHNAVQENIAQLIEAIGMTLVKGDHDQLRVAVAAMISNAELTPAQILAKLHLVDGSGSLLDADFLRGLSPDQVVSGARVLAALGFTPVQQGGGIGQGTNKVKIGWDGFRLKATVDSTDQGNIVFDNHITAAAILAKLLTVDGAGSTIDADFLRGLSPDQVVSLARVLAALGYTPLNKAGDTMTGLLTLSGAPTASLHAATKAYVDGLVTASALLAKLLTVDGSGSLTDADMLDGYHGSSYDRIVSMSIGQDGHIIYASGKKEIWGRVTVNSDSYSYVTYPFTFDTVPSVTFPAIGDAGNNDGAENTSLGSSTTTGFSVFQAPNMGALSLPYQVVGK